MSRKKIVPKIDPSTDGGWRRPWGGRVLHYYRETNWDTLCGKHNLRGHGEIASYTGAWPRCKHCHELFERARLALA